MWTGDSHPGDLAGSGCHCRNSESASEVSSLGQVSVYKEDSPRLLPGGEQGCQPPGTKQEAGERGVLLIGMWPFPASRVSCLTPPSVQPATLKLGASSTVLI